MNTEMMKQFEEVSNETLQKVIGGEGDFTRLMYKLGSYTREKYDSAKKYVCKNTSFC